jgi:hypothetical protein
MFYEKYVHSIPQQRKDFILETLTFFWATFFLVSLILVSSICSSIYCIFLVVSGAAACCAVAAIPEHGAWARGSGRSAGECPREVWQHAPTPTRVRPYLTTLRLLEMSVCL